VQQVAAMRIGTQYRPSRRAREPGLGRCDDIHHRRSRRAKQEATHHLSVHPYDVPQREKRGKSHCIGALSTSANAVLKAWPHVPTMQESDSQTQFEPIFATKSEPLPI
jgi:hypothetical protein